MSDLDQLEVWRRVPSMPGIEASSFGRVKKNPFARKMPHGGKRMYKPKPTFGQERRSNKKAKHSYRGIYFKSHGNIKIHRAVCEAFHGPAPFEGAVVIHIDEDAHNNNYRNLKWGTQKENMNMPKIKAYHRSRTGENNPYIKGRAK